MYTYFVLTCVLVLKQFGLTKCNDNNIDKEICVAYNSVYPSGFCLEHMKGVDVRINVDDIDKSDKQISSFFVTWVPVILDLIATTHKSELKRYIYDVLVNSTCFAKSDYMRHLAKELVDSLPSFEMINDNLPYLKWFGCHITFPICITSHKGNISLPCNNVYNIIMQKTSILRIVRNYWDELSTRCDDWFEPRLIIFKPAYFIAADIRHIEKCQKYNNVTSSQSFTNGCYNDNGVMYNGTVNVADNGKTCILWNSIPALRSNVYSNLVENYCRNPQGYGDRPWCYTDAQSRDWSYCHFDKCEKDKTHYYKHIALVSVAGISIIAIVAYLYVKKQKKEKRRLEVNIEPYYTYSLNSQQQIEELLLYSH